MNSSVRIRLKRRTRTIAQQLGRVPFRISIGAACFVIFLTWVGSELPLPWRMEAVFWYVMPPVYGFTTAILYARQKNPGIKRIVVDTVSSVGAPLSIVLVPLFVIGVPYALFFATPFTVIAGTLYWIGIPLAILLLGVAVGAFIGAGLHGLFAKRYSMASKSA